LAAARVNVAEAERRQSGVDCVRAPSSGSVFLPDVPTLSVFDDAASQLSSVRIGALNVPRATLSDVAYFPDVAVPIATSGYVPLESFGWSEVHDFWIRMEGQKTVDLDRLTYVDEDVCILSNVFSMTFGHWMTEELVSLYVHEMSGFTGKYVIDDRYGEGLPSFVKESLALLGIGDDRLITKLTGPTRFRSVTYAPVITHDLAAVYPDVYLGFREWMFAAAGVSEPTGGRRIWLARDKRLSGGRSGLINEGEVRELIEQHGFEIEDPGQLPFAEQIRMMAGVSVWAGAHGSATRHALFMPRRSTVIECFSPYLANKSNSEYFRLLQHDYRMIMMETAYDDYPWGVEVFVDVEHLAQFLTGSTTDRDSERLADPRAALTAIGIDVAQWAYVQVVEARRASRRRKAYGVPDRSPHDGEVNLEVAVRDGVAHLVSRRQGQLRMLSRELGEAGHDSVARLADDLEIPDHGILHQAVGGKVGAHHRGYFCS